MSSSESIQILMWNAQCIRNKSLEFFNYILDKSIDIVCLNETWLNINDKFGHTNYKCYRLDRVNQSHGGVSILVKKGLVHELLPSFKTKVIEAIGISVKLRNQNKIKIIAAYFPGIKSNVGINNATCFQDDLNLLTNTTQDYFICGDFNSKHRSWNCTRGNRAGNILFEMKNRKGFIIDHPNNHTYYPENYRYSSSTLDLVLTNGAQSYTKPQIASNLASDHLAISFEIHHQAEIFQTEYKILDYKKADWKKFRRIINEKINFLDLNIDNITTTTQVDDMTTFLTSTINESVNEAIPKVTPKNFKYMLTDSIKQLIAYKNSIRRAWQRNRQPQLRSLFMLLKHRVEYEIKEFRNKCWAEHLQNISRQHNNDRLWRVAKLLRNKQNMDHMMKVNNQTLLTPSEKANALADSFDKNHQITVNYRSRETDDLVNSFTHNLNSDVVDSFSQFYTKPKEIRYILKNCKNKKAPGYDNITNFVMKKLPRKALVYLTILLNGCIKLSHFPTQWKSAIVIGIPKPKKDVTNPDNYRPISLLSSISKIFEKVLLRHITRHMEEHNILKNEQFGFRRGHSTCHQLKRMVTNIKREIDLKKSVGMILLDIEKAFDSVWHDGLLYKLSHFGFPLAIIKIIKSFLQNRTFSVKYKNVLSTSRNLLAGVPQGSSLSPVLYNIYTSDLPDIETTQTSLYADDTALSASGIDPNEIIGKLTRGFSTLQQYYKTWRIKVNENKLQCIFFTKRRNLRYLPAPTLNIGQSEIPWSNVVKYLGMYLDPKLTFKYHTDKAVVKSTNMIRMFYSLINRRSQLCVRNKMLLYKSIFRPVLMYASPVWGSCAKSHRLTIQRQQNKLLKMILNLPRHHSTIDLHRKANLIYINDFISNCNNKFIISCSTSENPLINALNNII